MRGQLNRQSTALPNSFPPGSVYVVEGRGGERGHLRVSARYVILPGGRRIEVSAETVQSKTALGAERRFRTDNPPRNRGTGRRAASQGPSLPAKKFISRAGTSDRERR